MIRRRLAVALFGAGLVLSGVVPAPIAAADPPRRPQLPDAARSLKLEDPISASDGVRPVTLAASLRGATGVRQVVIRLKEQPAAALKGAANQKAQAGKVRAQQTAFIGRANKATASFNVLGRTRVALNAVIAQVDAKALAKLSREDALARLGLEAAPTPYSPAGIRLKGKPPVNRHALFLDGSVEVQDEGSQLLAYLLAPRRGEMVADFCAGAGGKTLALGALMRSTGRLYAFDISPKRLAGLKPRLARSGLSNVHPQRIEGVNDARVKRLAGKIDRVLVDAPCSGLGTLRRNPDMKWRQTSEDVAELVQKQKSILAAAARLVKPGGRLVYATCSILEEENRGIVEDFLRSAEFTLRPAGEVLEKSGIRLQTKDYLELWPHLHGTDGFFAAVLERAA